jgi:hypothetical protein
MKNQMLGRYILAFLIATTTLSPAQEKNLQEISGPVKDPASYKPRGIFALIKWGEAPEDQTWKDSGLDGVTLRRYWKEFNPAHKEYKWGKLDRLFAKADSFSKKISLIIAPGFYSPPWVLDSLDKSQKPLFVVPHGEYEGEKRPLPLPWNSKYLNWWFTFVDTLAKRYGAHPVLSHIAMTGPNSHNGEVNLPNKNKWKKEFPQYDPRGQWKDIVLENWRNSPGGAAQAEEILQERLLAAYKKTIKRFYKAFTSEHQKYLTLQIFNGSFPFAPESAIQDESQDELIKLARGELGKYFVLMNGGLEAWPLTKNDPQNNPPEPWTRIQRVSDNGFVTGLMQMDEVSEKDALKAGASEIELFRLIIKNGVRFGAGFLVIMEKDVHDARFRELLAAGRILLNSKDE